mmetsp:Transcript_31209/g.91601  ORF Transcript_31209/g.91601 Transcript_31209/m.91601 type:complete len:242 (-) Transcript_31209:226-951(-)
MCHDLGSASQLSYHGLVQLHASLAEAELAVFFRNNHFATITKHGGELYLLATDVGFAREPLVVWERRAQRRPCRPDSAQRAQPCSRGAHRRRARVGSTRSTAIQRSARASSSASRSRSPPPPPRRRPPPQSPPTSPRRRRARRRAWAQRRTRRPTWLWRSSCSGRRRSRRSWPSSRCSRCSSSGSRRWRRSRAMALRDPRRRTLASRTGNSSSSSNRRSSSNAGIACCSEECVDTGGARLV